MNQIYNLNKKRVCDISSDGRSVIIRKGDCLTIIQSHTDGTLRIIHQKVQK